MIKELSSSNVKDILSLDFEFSDSWTESEFVSGFNNGRFFVLGCVINDEIVGYIAYSLGFDTADVEGIAVKTRFRRNGIAKSLYKEAEARLISKNIEKVFLEVRESNFSAKNLYENLGFSQISLRKKYYSDGENAVVMCKELKK